MPVGPDYYDAVVDAVTATMPAGSEVRLYTQLEDPVTGPDSADELPADGGYAPAAVTSWSASDGGVASMDVDFGTSTEDWPETGVAWAVHDPDGAIWYFDLLQERVEVDEASTPVTAQLDIYYRSVD